MDARSRTIQDPDPRVGGSYFAGLNEDEQLAIIIVNLISQKWNAVLNM